MDTPAANINSDVDLVRPVRRRFIISGGTSDDSEDSEDDQNLQYFSEERRRRYSNIRSYQYNQRRAINSNDFSVSAGSSTDEVFVAQLAFSK